MDTTIDKLASVELELGITGNDGGDSVVRVSAKEDETVAAFADRISELTQMDGDAVVEVAMEAELPDRQHTLRGLRFQHHKLKLHRACIDVHFESEEKRHFFPSEARWARVHRWACRHFEVPSDACANLELRANSATGTPINERDKIGRSEKCRTLWVVKPGPELNG